MGWHILRVSWSESGVNHGRPPNKELLNHVENKDELMNHEFFGYLIFWQTHIFVVTRFGILSEVFPDMLRYMIMTIHYLQPLGYERCDSVAFIMLISRKTSKWGLLMATLC